MAMHRVCSPVRDSLISSAIVRWYPPVKPEEIGKFDNGQRKVWEMCCRLGVLPCVV